MRKIDKGRQAQTGSANGKGFAFVEADCPEHALCAASAHHPSSLCRIQIQIRWFPTGEGESLQSRANSAAGEDPEGC